MSVEWDKNKEKSIREDQMQEIEKIEEFEVGMVD